MRARGKRGNDGWWEDIKIGGGGGGDLGAVEELMRKADLNMLPTPDLRVGLAKELTMLPPLGVLGVESSTVCCTLGMDL